MSASSMFQLPSPGDCERILDALKLEIEIASARAGRTSACTLGQAQTKSANGSMAG
jgi:hypothetical protein